MKKTNTMDRVYGDQLKDSRTASGHKIKSLEELLPLVEKLRLEDKKIVHCHGVFDLLHIGHIRHFQEARKLGDVLVVTVTPDRFVNKGPHRPAFPEHLRVEAISALDVVDYVAINKWPMATEVIELLRPHFYVKGSDYKDAEKDHTCGISLEENMVKSVGGKIVFTDDISFSASSLINRHLPVFPDRVNEYRAQFASKYTFDDIVGYLNHARSLNVLVVGETIIDEYQYCEAIGKSSKEPMLAVKRISTEQFPGGILAVGNHVANFCDRVSLLSFLGDRHTHERFIREKLDPKVKPTFLYRTDSPTIVKRRFIESYFFTKLMEIYEINDGLLTPSDNELLCHTLESQLSRYDLVIVLDFGHGMLSPEAIELVCDRSKFLAVNAQSNAGNIGYQSIVKYRKADYVCIAESEMRMEARDRRGDLREMILNLSRKFDYGRVTVTRGQNGCISYSKADGFVEVPAFAGKIVDRMGAGDAFLSITALCVAQNAPIELVGFIGNVVGAQAIATVGHRSSIQRSSLYKSIQSLLK